MADKTTKILLRLCFARFVVPRVRQNGLTPPRNGFLPFSLAIIIEMSSTTFFSFTQTLLSFGADFFAYIVVAALIAGFALFFGSDRFMALVAGIYAAIPLYMFFPYKDMLGDSPYLSVGLYLLFAALALVAFSGLSTFLSSTGFGFVRTIILSVLIAGFLLAVAIHILPMDKIYTFSGPTKALFSSSTAYFWWLVAPLAGIFFFGRG